MSSSKNIWLFTLLLSTGTSSSAIYAEQLWRSLSLTYLYGEDYAVGDSDRHIQTFEYAGGHSWGDHFYFLDRIDGSHSSPITYTESLIRLSGNKLLNNQFKFGLISDVLIANRLEYASATDEFNKLIGVGIDLSIPKFTFFKLNAFYRFNDLIENNEMLNAAWAIPFRIMNHSFVYDGFFDWISPVDKQYSTSFNWTSQLKWKAPFDYHFPIYLGIEYSHWENKFGIKDTSTFNSNENNISAIIKAHF